MAILSVRFLWRACTLSGISLFSLAYGRSRSRLGQPAQAAQPNIMQYGACAVYQCDQRPIFKWAALAVWYFSWGTRDVVSFSLHPESQSTKKKFSQPMMKLWGNWWWNYDETYDVIGMTTVSKCLVRTKGWDPEFEPSVEEIVDYQWYNNIMAILSVHFLWRARTLGGFPYSV